MWNKSFQIQEILNSPIHEITKLPNHQNFFKKNVRSQSAPTQKIAFEENCLRNCFQNKQWSSYQRYFGISEESTNSKKRKIFEIKEGSTSFCQDFDAFSEVCRLLQESKMFENENDSGSFQQMFKKWPKWSKLCCLWTIYCSFNSIYKETLKNSWILLNLTRLHV